MTDRVYQCDCQPGSVAVRACSGDKPVCWANGNGSPADPVSVLSLLRELADKATPGPWGTEEFEWRVDIDGPNGGWLFRAGAQDDAGDFSIEMDSDDFKQTVADGRFIAASRSALPVLIAALEAVLQLHRPWPYDELPKPWCISCGSTYPCHEVRVVSENLSALTTNQEQR